MIFEMWLHLGLSVPPLDPPLHARALRWAYRSLLTHSPNKVFLRALTITGLSNKEFRQCSLSLAPVEMVLLLVQRS